jgi:hypothetical protein
MICIHVADWCIDFSSDKYSIQHRLRALRADRQHFKDLVQQPSIAANLRLKPEQQPTVTSPPEGMGQPDFTLSDADTWFSIFDFEQENNEGDVWSGINPTNWLN